MFFRCLNLSTDECDSLRATTLAAAMTELQALAERYLDDNDCDMAQFLLFEPDERITKFVQFNTQRTTVMQFLDSKA